MLRLAIFASGKGSNAANFCRYFRQHQSISVVLILSDRKAAGVFDVAREAGVESQYLSPEMIRQPEQIVALLQEKKIDAIILAGYLKLIPEALIKAFPKRIFNIHPALLPAFGGPGMYGMHVHEAVLQSGVKETGITVHEVNEQYDEGTILFQARTALGTTETAATIAAKIHDLEMEHFPRVIEEYLLHSSQNNF